MAINRKPKVWFDFDYLSALDDPESSAEIFILSEPAQKALSDLAEMVLWPTRWFRGHHDLRGQWETDQAARDLAYKIYGELKVPAHLDDLVTAVSALAAILDGEADETQSLLDQIAETIAASQCCNALDAGKRPLPGDGGGSVTTGGSGDTLVPGDVPYTPTDPPVTTATDPDDDGVVTESDFRQYLCAGAALLFEILRDWFEFARLAAELKFGAQAIIEFLVDRLLGILVEGLTDDFVFITLGEIRNVIQAVANDAYLAEYDEAIAAIDAVRDEFLNSLACGSDAQAAYDAARLAVSQELADIGEGAALAVFEATPMSFFASLLWNGVLDVEFSDDCSCDNVVWSHHTRFGTNYDGLGDWTTGDGVSEEYTLFRGTGYRVLSLGIVPIQEGDIIRVTAAIINGSHCTGNTIDLAVTYGGQTREVFSLPVGDFECGGVYPADFTIYEHVVESTGDPDATLIFSTPSNNAAANFETWVEVERP